MSDVRVRPVVYRCHGLTCWHCELCHEGSGVRGDHWGLMHDQARTHYLEVHCPGLQRIEQALRDLDDEPCGAQAAGLFGKPIGPCVLPSGHRPTESHEGPSGTTWHTLNGNPGQWVLDRPGEGPKWSPLPTRPLRAHLIEDDPGPALWPWVLGSVLGALIVAAAVLVLDRPDLLQTWYESRPW